MTSASSTDLSERTRPSIASITRPPKNNGQRPHPAGGASSPLSIPSPTGSGAPISLGPKAPAVGPNPHSLTLAPPYPSSATISFYDSYRPEGREKTKIKNPHVPPQLHELPKLQPSVARIKSKPRPAESDIQAARPKAHRSSSSSFHDEPLRPPLATVTCQNGSAAEQQPPARAKSINGAISPTIAVRPSEKHELLANGHRHQKLPAFAPSAVQKVRKHATPPAASSHTDHSSRAKSHDLPRNGHHSSKNGRDPETKPSAELNGIAKLPAPKKKVDRFGASSLARNAEKGSLHMVEEAYEADPTELDQPDNAGITPLQKAACQGHVSVVKYLIDKGCRIGIDDELGDTPLIDAVENEHLPVVKILLRAGVNPHHSNRNGERAIDKLPPVEERNQVHNELHDILWKSMQAWTSSHGDSHETEPEVVRPVDERPSARPDLLYIDSTVSNLRKYAGQGDTIAVSHFLTMVTPDVSCAVAAARGGYCDILNLIYAYMDSTDKDPDPLKYSETPLLAAIGRGHLDVIDLILCQDNFDPTRKTKDGKTYWELADERRGPKWTQEIQVLKRRYEEYETAKANGPKKRSHQLESPDEGTPRPSKLARANTDRSVSKAKPTSRTGMPSKPTSELSRVLKSEKKTAREMRDKPSSKSSSPQPVRDGLSRRRRVIDDDDEEEGASDAGSQSERPSRASPEKTSAIRSIPTLSKPTKILKAKASVDKRLPKSEKPEYPQKAIKRERQSSTGESSKSRNICEAREQQQIRRSSKSMIEKDELHRNRIAQLRESKNGSAGKRESIKQRPSIDALTPDEKEQIAKEVRDRVEREERSRIAKEEREKVLSEEQDRIARASREALEKDQLDRKRREKEQEDEAERERLESEKTRLRQEEEDRIRAEEERLRVKAAAEELAARQRRELLDALPPAIAHAVVHGRDRPLHASGLKMGVVETFLPLWTAPYRSISTEESFVRGNERWMMSWQVVGLLGLSDLDLSKECLGVSHWERIPVTQSHMDDWVRNYSVQKLCEVEALWPDHPDYSPQLERARVQRCRDQLYALWPRLCWVRLADVVAEIERREDLRALAIGRVDDGCFVSADGVGYGGRYIEGHASFGSAPAALSIRELIFRSHGLSLPQNEG